MTHSMTDATWRAAIARNIMQLSKCCRAQVNILIWTYKWQVHVTVVGGAVSYIQGSINFRVQNCRETPILEPSRYLSHHRVKDGTTSERQGRKEPHACHCVIKVTYSGIINQRGAQSVPRLEVRARGKQLTIVYSLTRQLVFVQHQPTNQNGCGC